jgi:hypothetical protein
MTISVQSLHGTPRQAGTPLRFGAGKGTPADRVVQQTPIHELAVKIAETWFQSGTVQNVREAIALIIAAKAANKIQLKPGVTEGQLSALQRTATTAMDRQDFVASRDHLYTLIHQFPYLAQAYEAVRLQREAQEAKDRLQFPAGRKTKGPGWSQG